MHPVMTASKYHCASKVLIVDLQMILTDKLMNGALVTPTSEIPMAVMS